MPSENGVPTSAVAPERSKIAPILISDLDVEPESEPFDPSSFLSSPQATPATSAKQSGSASLRRKRFILFPPWLVIGGRRSSVSERPYSEVVLGPHPQPGDATGFEEQEHDQHKTEDRQLDCRQ